MSIINNKKDEENYGLEWKIKIRCSNAEGKELEVKLSPDSKVGDLRTYICEQYQLVHSQTVRLIASGKLLATDETTLEQAGLKNESFVHAAISNKPTAANNTSNTSSVPQQSSNNPPPSAPPRGLDALRNLTGRSFTADDISAIRTYFSEDIQEYGRTHSPVQANENTEDYQARIEMEWMQHQGPNSEFQMNLAALTLIRELPMRLAQQAAETRQENQRIYGALADPNLAQQQLSLGFDTSLTSPSPEVGSARDFLFGVALGYLLGIVMIFCVWDRNVSHRQKLGIICGIMLQTMMNIMSANSVHNNHANAAKTSDPAISSNPTDSSSSSYSLRGSDAP